VGAVELEAVGRAEDGDGDAFGLEELASERLELFAGDGIDGGKNFVERREAAKIEFLAREIGHAGTSGLEGEHERALEMILGTEEFFLGDEGFLHGAEFGDGEVDDLADSILGGAGVDAEDSSVGIGRELAEDRVGEASFFANVLEEPRGHATAEEIVEDGGGEAALVGERNGGNTDANVDLLQVAFGFEVNGRGGGGHRIGGVEMRSGKIAKFLFDEIENFLVRDVASGSDEEMIGREPVPEASTERLAFEAADGVRSAENRAAERMIGPEAAGKDIVEKVFGIVHVHFDFFEDNLALFLNVFRIKFGAEHQIGEHVERNGEVRVEHLGVKADLFLGSEGIEHAADGIHFAGDSFGGAAIRTLENHVFEEVGDAVFREGFAAGAVADPDANGDRTDVLHGLGDDDKAVRKNVTMNIARVGDQGGHEGIVA